MQSRIFSKMATCVFLAAQELQLSSYLGLMQCCDLFSISAALLPLCDAVK